MIRKAKGLMPNISATRLNLCKPVKPSVYFGFFKVLCGLSMPWAFTGFSAATPVEDFNANGTTAAITLQRWYNHQGLWDTTGWWNAAHCVEALENVAVADNGQDYLGVIRNTFRRNAAGGFLNDYYDDEGWWALAWIRAYDLTGDARYLKMAKTIFKDMTGGWNDHCEGGLGWRKSHPSKNAVQNELFLLVAIRLHQRTPDDGGAGSYFDWAIKEWNWFKQGGLINPQNLVNDGLDRNCENNGRTTWTYNQGVLIGGLMELYKTTGDTNYLNQATAIADAAIATLRDEHGVLQEPGEEGGYGGGDVPQFKGIFIRYLADLYDETHHLAYRDFLLKNARSVWANDRDKDNRLGMRWSGPLDQADAARQSSAMMAVSALAEPATQTLPFCKGAGSVAFDHEVGEASGSLAWNCYAANTTKAGIMLAGSCASLAAGKHIVHFRMAVDQLQNSAASLVRLEVKAGLHGAVLASQQVPWNAFTAFGQSQDFSLGFTNAAANAPLELTAYWNAVSNAPSLTLGDVTVDGSHNWTAANLAHAIGRLDGLNGWEADPIRDKVSGYLIKGPGAKEFSTARYAAQFELKVDNFNRDRSNVATLSVVDADADAILAAREVTRDQFPDALYHTFNLSFKATAGRRYDFKTVWHYAPQAPRLTQRSLVVQPQTRTEKINDTPARS